MSKSMESLCNAIKSLFDTHSRDLISESYEKSSEQLSALMARQAVAEYLEKCAASIRGNYLAKGVFMHDLQEMVRDTVDREQYILDACKGKRVLHVGFADAPFETSLHVKIRSVAAATWGVDIDETAVEEYQGQTGDPRCEAGNVCGLKVIRPDSTGKPEFDVILVPELLEHVENVGIALTTVQVNCTAHKCPAIITVPNAFAFGNMFAAIEGKEVVHPDHRCWFSPQTLKKCINDAGLGLDEMKFYSPADMLATPGLTKSGIIARVTA